MSVDHDHYRHPRGGARHEVKKEKTKLRYEKLKYIHTSFCGNLEPLLERISNPKRKDNNNNNNNDTQKLYDQAFTQEMIDFSNAIKSFFGSRQAIEDFSTNLAYLTDDMQTPYLKKQRIKSICSILSGALLHLYLEITQRVNIQKDDDLTEIMAYIKSPLHTNMTLEKILHAMKEFPHIILESTLIPTLDHNELRFLKEKLEIYNEPSTAYLRKLVLERILFQDKEIRDEASVLLSQLSFYLSLFVTNSSNTKVSVAETEYSDSDDSNDENDDKRQVETRVSPKVINTIAWKELVNHLISNERKSKDELEYAAIWFPAGAACLINLEPPLLKKRSRCWVDVSHNSYSLKNVVYGEKKFPLSDTFNSDALLRSREDLRRFNNDPPGENKNMPSGISLLLAKDLQKAGRDVDLRLGDSTEQILESAHQWYLSIHSVVKRLLPVLNFKTYPTGNHEMVFIAQMPFADVSLLINQLIPLYTLNGDIKHDEDLFNFISGKTKTSQYIKTSMDPQRMKHFITQQIMLQFFLNDLDVLFRIPCFHHSLIKNISDPSLDDKTSLVVCRYEGFLKHLLLIKKMNEEGIVEPIYYKDIRQFLFGGHTGLVFFSKKMPIHTLVEALLLFFTSVSLMQVSQFFR